MSFSVAYVSADEFGIFPGSGWAILENSKRIDWPMLATRAEAESDLRGFRKSFRQPSGRRSQARLTASE